MSNEHDFDGSTSHEQGLADLDPGAAVAASEGGKPKRRARRSTTVALTAATVRRVLEDAEAITAADAGDRELAALLLGVDNDVVEIIAASSNGAKELDKVATDVNKIAGASVATRGIEVMEMDRTRLKPVWGVLEHLGSVKGTIPNTDGAAARSLAEAKLDARKIADALERAKSLVAGS